jgi:hypothetical protein
MLRFVPVGDLADMTRETGGAPYEERDGLYVLAASRPANEALPEEGH